ncbi:MAG: IclR family transcriptional regulator [Ruminococcaceae bacterium]|nr:IclR family transcriptional regulator [Oscillospiraceae bacterium]
MSKSNKALTLTEIAKEINVPKSSALDLVYTLLEKGFIEVDNKDFKTYRLGVALFELGATAVNKNNLQTISRPFLSELSAKTGKTVFLAVPKGAESVYINKIDGTSQIQSACSIGALNPLHLTGLGKAILAGMTNQEVLNLLGEGPYEVRTANTIEGYQRLIVELEQTRKRGYSIDNREGVDQLYCFGAPIYDYSNRIIAAVSLTMLDVERTRESDANDIKCITDTAMRISRQMGYSGIRFYSEML